MSSSPSSASPVRWGLIAGNGRFPFLVLEAARSQGIDMTVIAIREEASPELEKAAPRLHWVSLGELSRALELLHQEQVNRYLLPLPFQQCLRAPVYLPVISRLMWMEKM